MTGAVGSDFTLTVEEARQRPGHLGEPRARAAPAISRVSRRLPHPWPPQAEPCSPACSRGTHGEPPGSPLLGAAVSRADAASGGRGEGDTGGEAEGLKLFRATASDAAVIPRPDLGPASNARDVVCSILNFPHFPWRELGSLGCYSGWKSCAHSWGATKRARHTLVASTRLGGFCMWARKEE